MKHQRLGPMRATELADRLDHIDKQLAHLIGLVHALARFYAKEDSEVVAYEVVPVAGDEPAPRGNGKG